MLDLNLRFHAHCPRHPLYRPSDGPGAIKGGCPYCEALFRIGQSENLIRESIRQFEELLSRYEAKHVTSAPKEISMPIRQPELFPVERRR